MSATQAGWLSRLLGRGRSTNRLLSSGRSVPLGRVLGIRLGASPSWFVANVLLIVLLAGPLEQRLGSSGAGGYAAATAVVLLQTASILLHELGHALTARRLGLGITGIDLWIFGGVARPARGPDSPGSLAKVIAAGPAVTLVLVLVSVALTALLGGGLSAQLLLFGAKFGSSDALTLLSLLIPINFWVLVFNLVPAFPLDGGQLLRALIWKRTGDPLRAIRTAGRGGQVFAVLLIFLGVVLTAQGAPIGGISLVAIGWMLQQAARVSVRWSIGLDERIGGMTAADIMDAGPVALALPATTTAIRARDDFFKRYGWTYFPVVDEFGRLIGVANGENIEREIAAGRSTTDVRELVEAGDFSRWCVHPDRPLHALIFDGGLATHGSLLVVDDDDVLCGVVTTAGLSSAAQPPPAKPAA